MAIIYLGCRNYFWKYSQLKRNQTASERTVKKIAIKQMENDECVRWRRRWGVSSGLLIDRGGYRHWVRSRWGLPGVVQTWPAWIAYIKTWTGRKSSTHHQNDTKDSNFWEKARHVTLILHEGSLPGTLNIYYWMVHIMTRTFATK
jgi:hypothetical protein